MASSLCFFLKIFTLANKSMKGLQRRGNASKFIDKTPFLFINEGIGLLLHQGMNAPGMGIS